MSNWRPGTKFYKNVLRDDHLCVMNVKISLVSQNDCRVIFFVHGGNKLVLEKHKDVLLKISSSAHLCMVM